MFPIQCLSEWKPGAQRGRPRPDGPPEAVAGTAGCSSAGPPGGRGNLARVDGCSGVGVTTPFPLSSRSSKPSSAAARRLLKSIPWRERGCTFGACFLVRKNCEVETAVFQLSQKMSINPMDIFMRRFNLNVWEGNSGARISKGNHHDQHHLYPRRSPSSRHR